MEKTLLEIPTELLQAAKLTPEEAKRQLAIRLYQSHRLNSQQAAELAGAEQAFELHAWNDQATGQLNLDEFLDWASHDLKTPLNAIIGFTKVVLKGIDGPVTELQNTDLTTAFNGGQRMLALVSQLVEIARLNKGQIELSRTERNIPDYLHEVLERWKGQNPAKPLIDDIQISAPLFQIDPIQFRQIIHHALAFASIRITEGVVTLTASGDDTGLNITVQSQGKKGLDKMEMDSTMLNFIIAGLVKLHGGSMAEPEETDTGIIVNFFMPR